MERERKEGNAADDAVRVSEWISDRVNDQTSSLLPSFVYVLGGKHFRLVTVWRLKLKEWKTKQQKKKKKMELEKNEAAGGSRLRKRDLL